VVSYLLQYEPERESLLFFVSEYLKIIDVIQGLYLFFVHFFPGSEFFGLLVSVYNNVGNLLKVVLEKVLVREERVFLWSLGITVLTAIVHLLTILILLLVLLS
jgi:hypothetical protein